MILERKTIFFDDISDNSEFEIPIMTVDNELMICKESFKINNLCTGIIYLHLNMQVTIFSRINFMHLQYTHREVLFH